jgi:23S rRNA pseudouridine2605 synthase
MTRQRLHKLMAACGVGSRRACEDLITQGRVEVDGRTVTELGTQVDDATQEVRCDGQLLRPEPHLYYLINKPRGAICSLVGAAGKPRAVDYLPPRARDRRLYTIGRLDVDSEGALILTNDGELCHLVTHPRFGVGKTYRVEVEGVPDDATVESMRKGVWLAEGRTGPVDMEVVHRFRDRTLLAVTLQEGKRREIRRLCARFGHEVRRLTRMSIGPVDLGELRPGEVRALTPAEIKALRDSAQAVIRLGGQRLGLSFGARPGARPGGKPGAKPAGKPGARAGARPAKPGSRSSARTGGKPGARTGGKPSAVPLPEHPAGRKTRGGLHAGKSGGGRGARPASGGRGPRGAPGRREDRGGRSAQGRRGGRKPH